MKIECLKDNLEKALSFVGKISNKNTTLPVLQCVLLEADKNTLKIRATNLDVGIETQIKAKIVSGGKLAIPTDVFYRFISSLSSNDNITLEENSPNLQISTKITSTKINTMASEDFPTIPKLEKNKPFEVDSGTFVEGLKSVWYSASPGSLKPELSSVYISNEGGYIVFAATDSFRLAEKKIFGINKPPFESILIPFKNIPDILRFFESADRKVEVRIAENQISFSSGENYITSRTTDGNFPDYTQIIPKETTTTLTLLKRDLSEALKTSNVFANKFNQIHFSIDPQQKRLELKSQNPEVGESSLHIDAAIQGDPIEISFNYKYIMDCFQSIPQDSLTLKLSGAGKPMVISGVGDDSFTYLVMPMNK